jgi:transposase
VGLSSLLRRALCLQETVIEGCGFEGDALVLRVRPRKRDRNKCASCKRRVRYHDAGRKNRRWRSLDLGSMVVFLEADTHRVRCPVHGIAMAHVPWARPRRVSLGRSMTCLGGSRRSVRRR